MADRKLQYIIEMIADDSSLRKQMKGWNWEDIMGSSKGKSFKDVLVKDTKEAKQEIVNTLGGMGLDWGKILGEKEFKQLETKIGHIIKSNKDKLAVFANEGDTSSIQKTIDLVSALGNELKGLGSNFDASGMARNISAFMKVLTPLSAKFDALAKEPAKVEAAFDKLFNNNISDGAVRVSQGFTVIGNEAGKAATKTTQAIQEMEKHLSSIDRLFNKEYSIKFNSDLEEQFYTIDEQIEKVEEDINKIEKKFSNMSSSDKNFESTRKQLTQKYAEQSKLYRQLELIDDKYVSKNSKDDSLLTLNNIIPKDVINAARDRIAVLINDAKLQIEDISKSTKTTKDGINIPIKLPTQDDLIKTINQYVDGINKSKAIHNIKIGVDKDVYSPIEDQTKRAYGQNEADDDVNTTKMVEQTESRFDKIATAIEGKQNKILDNTKTWRKNMLEQFKFKSGDFEFKFNDVLIESLQSLFDDYELKVNIDPQHLADQIKTVLNSSDNTVGGGTANIDASSMASAIAMGLRAALTGEMPQVVMNSGDSSVNEDIPQQVDHIATEIQQSGRHLDLAEDYVKDVVEKLKAVAKYAAKDSKGSVITRDRFDSLGIDLHKVKKASDVGNDAEIVSIIENSLLQKDEFGKLKGSTIIDELSKFKGSSSKTIPAFLTSMNEVFFMLQENTQTVEEWTRKRQDKEIFDSARGKAQAAGGLRDVRSTIRQGDIPNIQTIETAISLMAAIGQNTDDLQTLKTAREVLGDKTDDALIEEFKTAADTFYKSSTKTFWDLKKQAEDTFKGTVYFQGKNGKTSSKYMDSYKQLANIKDDAVIVDIQVSSSLNNATLGTVKSKYSNRTSQAEEKRLIRNATRPDFIVPREYEADILNKSITYKGFKAQNVASVPIDFDATIEKRKGTIAESENTIIGLQKNITSLEQEIKAKQEEAEALRKTLGLIGVEQVYKSHTTDDYSKKFDTLYSLNKNSKVTSESNLPKEGYSAEIAEVLNKKTEINDRLNKLTHHAELIEKLTVEEAKKRLENISKTLVPNEEMTLYQKFIDNPIDKDVLKKSMDIKGYSKEEILKLKNLSIDEINKQLERGYAQRESIDLYSRFIQNPDSVRNDILSSVQQVTQESVSNQKKLDSYILTWAKSEEAKIPEAEAILKQAAEKVLSKIGSTMNSLYKDMITTEEKLKGSSGEEKTVLKAHMQDLFKMFVQAQEEYDNLVRQNKITRKKPLGADRLKNIASLQLRYSGSVRNQLNEDVTSTVSEIAELNSQKSRLRQQEAEAASQREHSESLIQRAEAEKEYNKLLEKSLKLQGAIEKMTADEADEKAIKRKQKELDKINIKLAESKEKIDALGGFLGQGNGREYSDGERKTYALEQLKLIEDDLITAKAQKRVSESRISKKDREIADLDKWGLGAGIGASELAKTKYKLTSEFMSGDYVQSQLNALKEKTKVAIAESENESRAIFDKKVAVAMEHLGWNPLDQTQVQKFLNTNHGQQLSSDFASEVDTNTTNIWKQYDVFKKDLLSRLKTEFQDSFKTDKGVLTATSKVQDETGQWVNEIVEVRVKEALRTRLEAEKRILEAKNEPIQDNIDRLEADKAAAVEYGGISDTELLSGEIIKDQIRKEIQLTEWKEKQIAAQEKLNELEETNIDHSDESYKNAKKELNEATKQVGYYEMLVKNRQKLVQLRYDESKEPAYTDEEKKLHFTNQIVTYNQKIEDSLIKQKELTEQIKSATGDEKTKLQRRLSIEEENVAKWREKIPTYESKLNKLNTVKPKEVAVGILPEGGIVGSIVSAVSEAISGIGAGVEINTEDLAKEATLKAILEVLGGVPSGGDDGYGLGRGEDITPTLETAKSIAHKNISKTQIYKDIQSSADAFYKTDIPKYEAPLNAVTDILTQLSQITDTNSRQYIELQRKLGQALQAYGKAEKIENGKGFYDKIYESLGKKGVSVNKDLPIVNAHGLSAALVEKGLVSIKEKIAKTQDVITEEPKQQKSEKKTETKKTDTTSEIKNLKELKQALESLRQSIIKADAGSEQQQQLQASFVNLLSSWSKNKTSGLDGKSLTSKEWQNYLIDNGVFKEIDTSITPLTNRQLKKSGKSTTAVTEKPKQKKTETKAETRTKSRQSTSQQTTGGLIQIVSRLATEDTLLQVLSALQTIGTVEGGKTAPTAAGDLYNQFKALLLGGSIDDHERLALMNSQDGLISSNVIGNIANISDELIRALRAKYPTVQGFDTQIHTHGKSNKPYFSKEDYNHFTKDYESGIKKQVLLTKDHISVLDLSAVKSAEEVQSLMDELIKAGNNAKAIKKVFENNKSGAMYESAKFDSLNANSLIKMIGANVDKPKDSSNTFESYISKIQEYKKVIKNAQTDGYLMNDDLNVERFTEVSKKIDNIIESISNGTPITDELKVNFEQLYRNIIDYGNAIDKTIGKNKNMYSSLSEINSVNKQRDKIIGTFGEDSFNDSNVALIKQYKEAYETLHKTYMDFAKDRTLYDTNHQEQLRRQAIGVQNLGNKLMASITQADDLRQKANQSGFYLNKQTGQEEWLGGISNPLTAEEANIKNLETTMRNYVQNTLHQANIENVKFNRTKQQLIYTFRTSKDTVADMVVQYNAAENALFAYNKQERESLTGWPAFIQGMKSKLKSITQYIFSITSITRVWGEVKKGIQYIREIDSALTELKKVTDETRESYDKFLKTAAKTADKIGSTIKEIVSSTADWARIGYSLQEATTLAESTAILLNVSEFQSIDDATSALTSTLQAFGYTANQSMDVVDVLNEVGNNFAISSDGIATALQDSASSLMAANNSYQQSVALIAAANRVVQDPNSVGAALRTISLRLRGTSTKELAEAGEDTTGVVESKSKLRTKIQGYTGIDILTDSGAYKSTYEILLEISKVWDDLTDQDRAGLLELIAGKTRSNTAAAILSNTKDLEEAYKSAMEAEGSALAENEKYLDSIQGKIDLFNNAIQTMWNTELDSGVIKFFVDFGTSLVKVVDNLGLINTLVFGLMSYYTVFKKQGKLDLASVLGIHDIEDGWFNKKKKKNISSTTEQSVVFEEFTGEQLDILSDESQTRSLINEKKNQIKTIKAEIKSLDRTLWKDIKIPDDALEYKTGNRKRQYVNEVLIPNKEAEIVAIQKDIDDITKAAKVKLDQSRMSLSEDSNSQMMFDLDGATVDTSKTVSKYLDIFTNGLGKGATEPLKVDFDKLSGQLKEIEGLDGEGLRNYMLNLGDLGDEADDTTIALAGYVSTVEDGKYSIQGAQRYVREYNKDLARMSKEAAKAQLKQSMLNLAISAVTMLLSALITKLIDSLAKAQNNFEKLSSQLSSTKSELESINSELDETIKRIEELQSQGSLSFVEQEELDRLKAQNEELKIQKELKEAIQKQQQKGVNSASVKAANSYYKKTGINSGKTTGEKVGQGAQYGLMAGGAVAGAALTATGGAAGLATALGVAGAANGWNPVGWGLLIAAGIVAIGTAIGAGIGAASGVLEEKVGESMDNMREQYIELQEEYNAAQSKYADNTSNGNYKKMQKAQEKLTEYESMMANHLTEMNAYYSQIDLSVYDPIKDAEEIKRLRNEMNDFYDTQDKWLIQSGSKDAKNNALTRIFGENAEDGLKRVKKAFKDAAEEGNKITLEEAFNTAGLNTVELDAFISRLHEMGLYAFETENYFYDLIEAEKEMEEISLYGVAVDINNITEGLENLKSAFDEVLESGFVTAKTLTELNELFGTLGDSWDNYVNTMFSGVSSTKEMQEATEALAKAFIDSKILTGEAITEYERMSYIIQLRNLGVTNAEEYVDDKIQENAYKMIEKSADYNWDDIEKEYKQDSASAKEDKGETWKSWDEMTEDERKSYADWRNFTKEINVETAKEIADQYGIEAENLNEVIDLLQQQIELKEQLADLEEEQEAYEKWLEGDGGWKQTQEMLDGFGDSVKNFDATNWDIYSSGYIGNITTTYTNKDTGEKLSSDEFEKRKQDYEEYQTLLKKLETLKTEGEEKGYIVNGEVVNPDYQKEIDSLNNDIDEFKKKIEEEYTLDIQLKLELQGKSDLVDQMQEIYDTLVDAEKEYNENGGYVSVDTLQSLLQLEPKYLDMLYDENGQLNLNKQTILQVAQARTLDMGIQAAQNVITAASEALEANKIDRLKELTSHTYDLADSNWALVDSQLGVLKTQIETRNTDVNDEMYGQLGGVYEGIESQVAAIKDLTNRSVANISNSFSSSGNTEKAEVEDAFKKAMDYWENRIGANQAKYEQIQNEIDLLEKQGKKAGKEYYEEQINLEEQRLELLESQKAEAQSFLNQFAEGSDEWWEAANTLNDLEGEIDDVASSIQDLSDAMAEVDWYIFDETHERFGSLIDDLNTIRDLISPNGEEDWFDDEGMWSDKGVASLATYVQGLQMYQNALDETNAKLKEYEKPYAGNESYYKNLGIDSEQELYDALEKLKDQQYDYAKSISDTEQSVVDMYESQIDAIEEYTNELVESYNDYIDVVKEALDAERDLYDFKKNIQKQTKDIAALERRIASLSGSDSAADIAERRKLEAELFEAKEGLNDTYYDHAKDSQSQALDDEAEAYEKSMTNYIDTLRDKLDEAKRNMDLFMEQVTTAVTMNANTVLTKYTETGIEIDSALTKPWESAAEAMKDYESDSLTLMNSWTQAGSNGFIYNFNVNATDQLTSPWAEGSKAADSFKNSIDGVMSQVVSNIKSNVQTATNELNKIKNLYADINDTTITAPTTNTSNPNNTYNPSSQYIKGEDVTTLQKILNQFFDAEISEDGVYGPATSKAVMDMKKVLYKDAGDNRAIANGEYDREAQYMLQNYLNKRVGGNVGSWFRENKLSIPAAMYAKGTLGTTRDELAVTDESWIGEEITLAAGKNGQLQYLKKGSAVMPADISANLVEWGKLNPDMMKVGVGTNLNMISNAVNKPEFNLSFDALVKADRIDEGTLPEIKKYVTQEINNLVKQMNYAIKGYAR